MERYSKANLRPEKSFKGNLHGPLGQSKVWRTPHKSKSNFDLNSFEPLKKNKFFPIFDYTALKKWIVDFKYNTIYGTYWDVLQVLLSLVSCAIFVSETYTSSFEAVRRYNLIEQIITQFFLVDFLLSWFVSVRTTTYFSSPMTWVDLITILPSYLIYLQDTPDLSALRFVRILRLIRILRTFRLLGGFSGVKKQMITICLLILSLTFLAAGIYNLCENDFNQLSYDCKYINRYTNYEPSCDQRTSTYDDPTCDCQKHNCVGRYLPGDEEGQPSLIKCPTIGFLESYYFTVVTICSVGYGDFSPTNQAARIIIMIYIATAFIMIPIQINKLEQLITMNSPFRTTFQSRPQETHIILCGHVNDKQKLSRIFREFFHPDRQIDREFEINLCILCPSEPNEEVKDLLSSPLFDNRVSYIIGSALDMEDLRKARGDVACAMFFLSNIEVDEEDALLDDAATVLRTLSVNNFNPNLDCYVQILRSQERDLLKDSNAELILCYDEYKTILQSRNALCPGLATMVENLFHTFGSIKLDNSASKVTNDWLSEYSYGARMEIYYVPIDLAFFGLLGHSWQLLVEAIYLEFECLLVGVCNLNDYSAHFNPRASERRKYKTVESYFEHYSLGLLLAPNNTVASTVRYALSDTLQMESMIEKLQNEEMQFMVRRAPDDLPSPPPIGHFMTPSARALSVRRSFRARSIRGKDIESLKTEGIENLRNIQFALDNEFHITRTIHIGKDVESGMESDSSEENDDDFLGYTEHDDIDTGKNQRRVGVLNSSTSRSFMRNFSESSDAVTPIMSTPTIEIPSTPIRSEGSGSTTKSEQITETNLLDSIPQARPRGGSISLKTIQNMKRAASSRKMSSLRAFRNTVAKKNKVKSLKQAASLIKTMNKLNGAGGFAALVKAAASVEPTPDNLVPKPASIVTALQQTRATKQSKLSLFDAVKLANVKEVLNSSSPEAGIEVNNTSLLASPEKSVIKDLSKFQTIKEEEYKSARRALSTRTSSCYVPEKVESSVQAPNDQTNSTSLLKSQNSIGTNRNLTRSQSKSLARAQSRGVVAKQLSRADSQVGEIVSVTPVNRISPLGRSSMGFGQARRPSVDSGLAALGNPPTKGRPSDEIEDAAHLKNHVIVFGCMDYISTFVLELRKKLLSDSDYRPILIVAPQEPRKWYQIRTKHDDVFLLNGAVTSAQDLVLMNIRDAHALVMLAHRQAISVDETSNVDSETLFLYLTIEKLIPRTVFFTVELCRPNNMGVLNSVIVRRNKMEKNAAPQPKNMTAMATALYGNDAAGTGMSLKLRGSHKFRGSVDVGSMMTRLQSEKSIDEKAVAKMASRRANVFDLPDLSNAPSRSLSISSMISTNPALHSTNQVTRRKLRANRKVHTINFWDVDDTHHVLPVFASGKAVCPTAFDSILCQSFFGPLTSQLCEKLVGGQETQTLFQYNIPRPFYGRKYADLFRACLSRSLLPFGLYRSPLPKNGAILPYVYTNPRMETVLAGQDKIILFGNPQTASAAFQQFEIPLDRRDGKISLGAQVSSASFHEKKRKSVNNEKNPIPNNSRISPASNYQPLGGMKNYSPSSEYQPLGGVKRSSPKNNSPNSEYQPFSGNRKTNVPPSPSDYQPMGARLKPNNTENKSPSSSVSQYVPRGAARIHPMSQTPILDNSNAKVDDDIVTIT